jgi:hypothetical protein
MILMFYLFLRYVMAYVGVGESGTYRLIRYDTGITPHCSAKVVPLQQPDRENKLTPCQSSSNVA